MPDKGLVVELGVVLNTAKKYKKLAGWCTVHVRRVTLLNAKHMLDRVEWCDDNEDENFRDRSMADESTFTMMAEIKKANGNNTFKLPHTGIRTQMRAEGWDI